MDSTLLDYYRALEAASQQMLTAARKERWDEVARIEQASKVLISQLKEAASRHAMSRADRREKMRIMHRIVLVDAEVRNLAQPWLADLERMFGGRPPAGTHLGLGYRSGL